MTQPILSTLLREIKLLRHMQKRIARTTCTTSAESRQLEEAKAQEKKMGESVDRLLQQLEEVSLIKLFD